MFEWVLAAGCVTVPGYAGIRPFRQSTEWRAKHGFNLVVALQNKDGTSYCTTVDVQGNVNVDDWKNPGGVIQGIKATAAVDEELSDLGFWRLLVFGCHKR